MKEFIDNLLNIFDEIVIFRNKVKSDFITKLNHDDIVDPAAGDEDFWSQMKKHMAESAEGGFVCLICGKYIRQRSNAKRHFEDVHNEGNNSYYCPSCDKSYKGKNSFRSHMYRSHSDWKNMDVEKFAVKN